MLASGHEATDSRPRTKDEPSPQVHARDAIGWECFGASNQSCVAETLQATHVHGPLDLPVIPDLMAGLRGDSGPGRERGCECKESGEEHLQSCDA